jgi:hypothetical protein
MSADKPAGRAERPRPGAGTVGGGRPVDRQELVADIERTRRELGDTVEALVAKLDVKSRTRDRATEVKEQVTGKAGEVMRMVHGTGGQLKGQAVGTAGRIGARVRQVRPQPARRAVVRAGREAQQRRVPLVAAAAALAVLGGWLVRRRLR